MSKRKKEVPYSPDMLLEGEIWKPVVVDKSDKDYSELYLISSKGRLRSLLSHNKPRDVLMNDTPNRKGYIFDGLSIDGKSEGFRRHRLVLLTFVGPPPTPKHIEVNHINEIKNDNNLTNLEWCTRAHNINSGLELKEQQDCSNSISVVQLDLECNIVETYKSSHEASRVTGFGQGHINAASKGMYSKKNSHKYKNFYWVQESELDEFLEKYKKNRKIKGE